MQNNRIGTFKDKVLKEGYVFLLKPTDYCHQNASNPYKLVGWHKHLWLKSRQDSIVLPKFVIYSITITYSPYLCALNFGHSVVWNFQFNRLIFFPSFNWIFYCKFPVQTCKKNLGHQTRNFKLENVKNQVQIDRGTGCIIFVGKTKRSPSFVGWYVFANAFSCFLSSRLSKMHGLWPLDHHP